MWRGRRGGDSPHARGWTAGNRVLWFVEPGFPARAGMDPERPPAASTSRWIPRTRGDGPGFVGRRCARPSDSPHARGWTRPPRPRTTSGAGFPARAGMDPGRTISQPDSPRIPRTRGDGPSSRASSTVMTPDSPHARGWTLVFHGPQTLRVGFPARAGMDPWSRASSRAWRRIPRTRGDGPWFIDAVSKSFPDSPHARGWTLQVDVLDPMARGFPARAGMDPPCASRRAGPPRIPRTRGDGPLERIASAAEAPDSPHARGWTREAAFEGRHPPPPGFPARAGMDPFTAGWSRRCPGIPRTRGDGPA